MKYKWCLLFFFYNGDFIICDIYKRWNENGILLNATDTYELPIQIIIKSVSYTHLDVYKRQEIIFLGLLQI